MDIWTNLYSRSLSYLCSSCSRLGQDGVEVLHGEGHVLDAVAVHRQMLSHLLRGLGVGLVAAVQRV